MFMGFICSCVLLGIYLIPKEVRKKRRGLYLQIPLLTCAIVVSFPGDIGGCIGLFVGASIITAFEVIDIFLHTALKMSQTWRETPQRAS